MFLLFLSDLYLKTFSVWYKIAKNFPLDLYFLNDPSPTMKTLQSSLKSLAKDIGEFYRKKWLNIPTKYWFFYSPYEHRDTIEKFV